MPYSAPRGTADVLPSDSPRWRYVESKFRDVCRVFGFEEIRTPTFEESELFTRSIGEHTDIVSKEMYTFADRKGRSMTLRPEGTAPVVRAYLEHKLDGDLSVPVHKLYYITSIFRYERPQAGRYREHHQVGIEAIGSQDPAIDAEVINLAMAYLDSIGIGNLTLRINSVGCPKCRPGYRDALRASVAPYVSELCESCRTRYDANPLRMLDCKVDVCRERTVDVPKLTDYLCEECAQHFKSVLRYLDVLNVPYVLDPRLVRGFDYYTKTAFEVQSSALGAQSAVVGGGRYDGLVSELGGNPTPAIGFGSGIERALAVMDALGVEFPEKPHPYVFVTTLGDAAREVGVKLLASLRRAGVAAETDYCGKGFRAQLKAADRLGARYMLIMGDDELAQGVAKARDMKTKEETVVPLDQVVEWASRLNG